MEFSYSINFAFVDNLMWYHQAVNGYQYVRMKKNINRKKLSIASRSQGRGSEILSLYTYTQ
jgi:hypothetical protein